MQIIVDARWVGIYGIQRYAAEVLRRAPSNAQSVNLVGGPSPSSPLSPFWLSRKLACCGQGVFFSPGYMPPAFSARSYVVTLHDLIPLRSATKLLAARCAFFQFVVRPAARRAARILTVSEFSRREIIDWLDVPPERVVVVGNGVDPKYCPGEDQSKYTFPYVLYVGGNKPHKNLRRLMAAFASPAIPSEFKLVLSGDSNSELASIICELGIGERIVFAGRLSEDELVRLYRGAAALALVSLYEGFGLPILEAMACGTPVVTSNSSSLPEVAGEAAVYVDPISIDSIAGGISVVLRDESLRSRLRQAGLERAGRFSWDRTAGRVWDVVEQVTNEKAGVA